MDRAARILIVEDEEKVRRGISGFLADEGHRVESAGDLPEAIEKGIANPPDLILLDLRLPGGPGLELIEALRERSIDRTFVVLTGHGTIDSAVEATKKGAFDYLEKPVSPERLRAVLARGLERAALRSEIARLRREMMRQGRFEELVGKAPRMLELYRLAEKVAPTNAPVLISGESGTGKEVLARSIHRLSPRAGGPFVPVNCAAIPENLLESEVFGHEKGAFTGAATARAGCFEQATGGTLFLDEIGEMPLDMQSKFLRVLEGKTVRRIGGSGEIQVDVRVIAATNRDLDRDLEEKRFREDLYFRLNVFALHMPPLRDRLRDVPALAEHFLRNYDEENGGGGEREISEEAIELMRRYSWPGNVRELRNVIQRAVVLCPEGTIRPDHLPGPLRSGRPARGIRPSGDGVVIPLGSSLEEAEKEIILRTLHRYDGNRTRTADVLGISQKTLYTRLRKYGEEAKGREGAAD